MNWNRNLQWNDKRRTVSLLYSFSYIVTIGSWHYWNFAPHHLYRAYSTCWTTSPQQSMMQKAETQCCQWWYSTSMVSLSNGASDASFCRRHGKSCDSLHIQYVTDSKGRLHHVISGLVGSTRDKTAASWSLALWQFLHMHICCAVCNMKVYKKCAKCG